VDILKDEVGDQKNISRIQDYLAMVDKNAGTLEHFINELLDLAEIQQSKVHLVKRETDLSHLLRHGIDLIRPMAEQARVAIHLAAEKIEVVCDAERIQQVISNLLSNAIKAAPGSDVRVTVDKFEHEIQINVTDNGAGIRADHLPHIFSSFFHVDKKTTAVKGSGLGLAVAKGWVEAHGGKIWAESNGEGQGATVTFTLPSYASKPQQRVTD